MRPFCTGEYDDFFAQRPVCTQRSQGRDDGCFPVRRRASKACLFWNVPDAPLSFGNGVRHRALGSPACRTPDAAAVSAGAREEPLHTDAFARQTLIDRLTAPFLFNSFRERRKWIIRRKRSHTTSADQTRSVFPLNVSFFILVKSGKLRSAALYRRYLVLCVYTDTVVRTPTIS